MTDRKAEVGDTLWFINHCGGCPFIKMKPKSMPICTKRNRVVFNLGILNEECPLEMR